jgi:outer membrane protein OmpA-like peptidoglycan-associated protein
MTRSARVACVVAAFAIGAAVAGCATRSERIILLPEQDARSTAVIVKQGGREVKLDKPYAATELSTFADPWSYRASEAEVKATFRDALAAQPARATHFTLYFIEGSSDLTEESKPVFESVFADLKQRAVADVVVVGHTDAVGSDAFNDDLAKKRAESIRAALLARGLAATDVVAISRGKRELLVPTKDGVAEPRNRRVEIVVR